MRGRVLLLLLAIVIPLSLPAAGYHYQIRDGGFWIHNGPAYFNRPLFGTHEPSMLLSGDRPAFAYIAPTEAGKIGTLYLGLITARGGKWLNHFTEIDSVYQPGLTRHIVQDPGLGVGSLEVTAVPLSSAEGFAIRLRWIHPPAGKVRLVWVFGGASGYDVNYSWLVSKLQLAASDTVGNVVHLWGSDFSLTSPKMKGKAIWGTCDLPGRLFLKDAAQAAKGPIQAEHAPPSKSPVVVFAGDWPRSRKSVHLLFTMAGVVTLAKLAAHPASTFAQSVDFYRTLARRVQVHTPDPYFDLAVESIVIENDGLWQPPSFLHGAMSWMEHYLGWRGWYGSEALGWHDRVLSAILAFAAIQIQSGDNRGAIPDMLGSKSVFYNMDEVYLDDIYYHYLWTGDRSLLASLFPVIRGILSWEKRRLDPDNDWLYENCLNTWISDSHWYDGGDCTQASAYMFRGYELAAAAAKAAGADPEPYLQAAERIRRAMNDKLWLASQGHYAEYIDRMGLKRIHPSPELPTIYFPIDFGVTDPFQAYQMLRFTETRLRNATGIPRGGRLVWSSNWAPNYDKHYTHSTYDLIFAENLNLAIAYYRAGQYDKAYDLVKGVYASMYQGGIPGGLSCHAYSNGQQRANEEFGDAISMFARTAVEGVFGILPEMQHDVINISPGFPSEWNEAAISTPDLSYQFRRTSNEITLQARTVRAVRIRYHIPLFNASLVKVFVNGSAVEARLKPGIGESFVDVTGPVGNQSDLRIEFRPRDITLRYRPVVVPGEPLNIHLDGARYRAVKDPQGVLGQMRSSEASVSGTVNGTLGPHTLFLQVGGPEDSRWEAVNVEVRPAVEILNPHLNSNTGKCEFALRNNTATDLDAHAKVLWAGRATALDVHLRAGAEDRFTAQGNLPALLLGKNSLEISGLPGVGKVETEVLYWPKAPPAALRSMHWKLLPLSQFYNGSLSTLLFHHFWSSDTAGADPVCRDYMLAHLVGSRSGRPNDNLLRSEVNDQGVFVTHVGIPFAQRAVGNNLVALSLTWKTFPDRVVVPVESIARKIYFLISGVTFPMQSQIANARITINYADGGKASLDLVNPKNFDSGWAGFFGGSYHYAENGMEVIGNVSPGGTDRVSSSMPVGNPGTILGQAGVPQQLDYHQWAYPTHADIVDVDCDPTRKIQSVELRVLSNDIIVALHGVTALK